MTQSQDQQVQLANLVGAIERLAGELALGEEPARFIAALEGEEDGPEDE